MWRLSSLILIKTLTLRKHDRPAFAVRLLSLRVIYTTTLWNRHASDSPGRGFLVLADVESSILVDQTKGTLVTHCYLFRPFRDIFMTCGLHFLVFISLTVARRTRPAGIWLIDFDLTYESG
jgi:hypothetical protein